MPVERSTYFNKSPKQHLHFWLHEKLVGGLRRTEKAHEKCVNQTLHSFLSLAWNSCFPENLSHSDKVSQSVKGNICPLAFSLCHSHPAKPLILGYSCWPSLVLPSNGVFCWVSERANTPSLSLHTQVYDLVVSALGGSPYLGGENGNSEFVHWTIRNVQCVLHY